MTQQIMTEKDQFLAAWEREYDTTLRVLKAYPAGKESYKPSEKSRSAKELAWTFVMEEKILESILQGKIDFSTPPPPPPPGPIGDLIAIFEKSHRDLLGKVKAMPEADLYKSIAFPVAPKQMGQLKRAQVMWTMLMDSVHHRGQFSVYLRLVGARVPSIYGPTADEPWM